MLIQRLAEEPQWPTVVLRMGGMHAGGVRAKDPPKRREPRICVLSVPMICHTGHGANRRKKEDNGRDPSLSVARSFGGGVGPPLREKNEYPIIVVHYLGRRKEVR